MPAWADQSTANPDSAGLVSVIIATLDCADELRGCLDSIGNQSYQRREIIAVDGGSSDGTLEVLQSERAKLAQLITGPDDGLYQAWNKGVRRARGEWLCFLGCDDRFHNRDALGALARAAADGEHRIVYGRMNLVAASGVVAETVGKPWAKARRAFLAGFMIPHPGTLHHRSLFEQRGPFDESYRVAGDYEFVLRELIERDAGFVDRLVVDMRLGGMSVRPEAIHSMLLEVARARRAHGLADLPLRLRIALAASWLGARVHRYLGEDAFRVLADGYRIVRGRRRVWTV